MMRMSAVGRRRLTAAATVLAALALFALTSLAASADQRGAAVDVEWLGWSHFRLTSPSGMVVLLNPWAENPDSPVRVEDITRADLIFAANGHLDEIGNTVELAQRTGSQVFAPLELLSWFIEQGVPEAQIPARFANPGDRLVFRDITLRMVNSIHGSGLPAPTLANPYGGPASGVFITFENGFTLYFAGSTAATRDQEMWAEMYRPDLAILPLNANRDPLDFAMQVKQLVSGNPTLKAVMPHHHRVAPGEGQTTIAEVREAMDRLGLSRVQLISPVVGQVMQFTKQEGEND